MRECTCTSVTDRHEDWDPDQAPQAIDLKYGREDGALPQGDWWVEFFTGPKFGCVKWEEK